MSLINNIREKRDSWLYRFEEHRKDEGNEQFVPIDREKENEVINKNRSMVGVFPKKEDYQGR